MSYLSGSPNGKLYVGNVKWSNDYKHCMLFSSKTARDNFMITNLSLVSTNRVEMSKNGVIKVDKHIENIEQMNYAYFINDSDISTTPYCCFITDYEYQSPSTTILYVTIDVFQMYFYTTTFYKSLIERGHTSNDTIGRWVAPEPIGFPAEYQVEKNIFSDLNFTPHLVMLSNSAISGGTATSPKFRYGGNGDGENMTGQFLLPVPNAQTLKGYITLYSLGESGSTINHLSDLIDLHFIPEWVYQSASWDSADNYVLASNSHINKNDSVTMSTSELASGYSPKNNKMFTSLARCILVFNRNGLSIPLKPELLSDSKTVNIQLSMRPMSKSYKLSLTNYKDINSKYLDLQYNFSMAFGFNSNVGVARDTQLQMLSNQADVIETQQISNAVGWGAGALGSVGQLAMGDIAGGLSGLTNSVFSFANQLAQNKAQNYQFDVSVANAVSSIGASIGNSGDNTDMKNDYIKIRIADCSPNPEECRIIDDYLTQYGYAIKEIDSVSNWLHTRKYWNFIQTANVNLRCMAPSTYEQALKNIFNAGLTLWHDYSNFGNYELNNIII